MLCVNMKPGYFILDNKSLNGKAITEKQQKKLFALMGLYVLCCGNRAVFWLQIDARYKQNYFIFAISFTPKNVVTPKPHTEHAEAICFIAFTLEFATYRIRPQVWFFVGLCLLMRLDQCEKRRFGPICRDEIIFQSLRFDGIQKNMSTVVP